MSDAIATDARDGSWLRGCDEPLVRAYDAVLLDLDGVVYSGDQPVDGAAEAIEAARAAGCRVAFVTNNASRPPQAVADQLTELRVEADADDVVTSAQAAARLVAERVPTGSRVLVIGGTGLRSALSQHDLCPVVSADERPVAVVQGFATDIDYAGLAEAALAVRAGALFVATNMDTTLPSPRGPLPGNGTLVGVTRAATGVDPLVAGKPEPALMDEARRRTRARRPLMVGDRLGTDIAAGVRAGIDTLLVLTGVTSESELVSAPLGRRPTYLSADLGGLLVAHPPVRAEVSGRSCGGWTATVEDGGVRLAGGGTYADGLRAVCAAAWAARERPDCADALAALPA